MKTKFKTLKLIAIAVTLFALPFNASASAFDLYLCGGGTASLLPDVTVTGTLKVNDIVVWQEFNATTDVPMGTATQLTVTANGVAPSFPLPALGTGAHNYKVFVISASANSCSGDVSDAFKIYALPAPTITLAAPTLTFCESGSNTALTSSVITATAAALATELTDVSYEFVWSATKDANAVGDVTTVGTIDPILPASLNVNTFTLNNTAGHGAYIFKAKINYKVAAGTLKGDTGTGCIVESGASPTINVTAKPAKPIIRIAP
ncbi:hypothetical protein H9X96_01390 [Pedobacter sp. N36a]|uniref:hypothetical protein n=1 Tax=Pedobacter sp. N36a TaxID=2767996 RepID=UPI0016570F1C|nr:hypothetical protein [Pedobacter sp. N36a]MBC8984424.1 hypothetical protein [Pedobacter sp. N36a]